MQTEYQLLIMPTKKFKLYMPMTASLFYFSPVKTDTHAAQPFIFTFHCVCGHTCASFASLKCDLVNLCVKLRLIESEEVVISWILLLSNRLELEKYNTGCCILYI